MGGEDGGSKGFCTGAKIHTPDKCVAVYGCGNASLDGGGDFGFGVASVPGEKYLRMGNSRRGRRRRRRRRKLQRRKIDFSLSVAFDPPNTGGKKRTMMSLWKRGPFLPLPMHAVPKSKHRGRKTKPPLPLSLLLFLLVDFWVLLLLLLRSTPLPKLPRSNYCCCCGACLNFVNSRWQTGGVWEARGRGGGVPTYVRNLP